MAKFRLKMDHRHTLNKFARKTLVCGPEAAAEDSAFTRLSSVVNHMLTSLAPESDMVVLRKHKATQHVESLTVRSVSPNTSSGERWLHLCFCPRDPSAGTWRSTQGSCRAHARGGSRVIREVPNWLVAPRLHTNELLPAMADDLIARYDEFSAAADRHDDARNKVLEAVEFAISKARTLEDLIAVWPQAEAARPLLGASQLPAPIAPSEFEQRIASATFSAPVSG